MDWWLRKSPARSLAGKAPCQSTPEPTGRNGIHGTGDGPGPTASGPLSVADTGGEAAPCRVDLSSMPPTVNLDSSSESPMPPALGIL